MIALDDAQRAAPREDLERDRAALLVEIDRIEREEVKAESQYDAEFSGYGTHMAETGTEIFEQERGLALEQALKAQMAEVEHALAKLEAGSYGRCDNCGRDIALDRLLALPRAALCIACKEQQENRLR